MPFLRRIVREGWYHVAAVESLGALMITAGWLMRGRTLAVVINGAWLIAWTAFWLWHLMRQGRNGAASA